jgi:hypothetical protein
MFAMVPGLCASSRVIAQSESVPAVEFRIDTDVYLDSSRPPIATTQTLFLQDRIVDWDDARRRMMRVDLRSQQIELADFENQRRFRIDIQQLTSRIDDLRSQLTQEQLAAWASTQEPRTDQGGYVLESGNFRYRFKTVVPARPEMAVAYSAFANWSAQISAVYPPFKPPLLRLQLNEFLELQRVLPSEIRLTDLRSQSNESLTARVLVQNALTTQDRERIKDWDVLIQTLQLVSDKEFFGTERSADRRAGSTK